MPGGVRSASLTGYADVARRAGLDPVGMLREFGLPPRCLESPEMRIPVDAVRRLIEASAERSGLEGFGLLMAEARRLSNLGPLGLLVREQPTLRLAVEAFVRHGRRLNDALFLTLEDTGNVVVLREELIVGRTGPVRQSTELAIGVAYRTLCALLGPQWRPRRVCFAHAAPRDGSVHARLFGRGVVEFGHDFNGIVCMGRDLDLPNPGADAGIADMAHTMLDSSAVDGEFDITMRVRDLVVQTLGSGRCTVEQVAEQLGVDRRTIHRRLAREGTTFSDVVDSVRSELAVRYLANDRMSLGDIASLLGFAAASSFSRWYRATFESSPSSSRRAVR